MLTCFDSKILLILENLSNPYGDIMDNNFCETLRRPGAMQERRHYALQIISWELWRVYRMPVVVLVDEYDAPMHSAMEHDYSREVRFFLLNYSNYLMSI